MYGFNDLTVGWRPWGWCQLTRVWTQAEWRSASAHCWDPNFGCILGLWSPPPPGLPSLPSGLPHHRLYHEESSIWSYRRKDYSWWSLEHFSCWLSWKNLVWSLYYWLKNSGELIFCCLLFNTYQSSSTTTSPLEVIFFVPNRISWRGLTRVIPLAEMARVRICNYKRHTLYCICIPRKVDKKELLADKHYHSKVWG